MKNGFVDILKGKFLISREAGKTWRFMLFISGLAVIMISSSHSADQKVQLIAKMNEEVQELRSEYVDIKSKSQQLKLESRIKERVSLIGLNPSVNPPKKIKVKQ